MLKCPSKAYLTENGVCREFLTNSIVAGEPTIAENNEPFRIGPFSAISLMIIIGIIGYVLLSFMVALVFWILKFHRESKKSVQIDQVD